MLTSAAYKMQTHIAKSLQTCCATIHKAVEVYNQAASLLNPPHPPLDWTAVSHYSFLDEFNLLRDTRQDILNRRWTEPAVRATMKQDLRVKRAYEEIERCNIEVRCLHTSIHDKNTAFSNILSKLRNMQDPLYGPVEEYDVRWRRANAHLQAQILQIHNLLGFTGDSSVGVKKGHSDVCPVTSDSSPVESLDEEDQEAADDVEPDDQTSGDIATLVEYMTELPIHT
jgi:hypothetical protein